MYQCKPNQDYGGTPFAADIQCSANQNKCFRRALWTGEYLQMTLMNIPKCGEIGLEMHEDTDQFIRVESGCCVVKMGKCKDKFDMEQCLSVGDGVFVPAGTWHNICNTGSCPLKLSSIYAPPHHPKGTVHPTKMDADHAGY